MRSLFLSISFIVLMVVSGSAFGNSEERKPVNQLSIRELSSQPSNDVIRKMGPPRPNQMVTEDRPRVANPPLTNYDLTKTTFGLSLSR